MSQQKKLFSNPFFIQCKTKMASIELRNIDKTHTSFDSLSNKEFFSKKSKILK